ncbi:hypothetical protein O181_043614 [Austropuccinia psidii MF-1]|uniref:Uncharacterized protein n=1 Tax=Austropuccinia psidii MF-1 TaxID=1389203 RepID=A0A9Q3DID9_9BASI|nr:hypothetical protein [Austropuccinia psidii MF-1]
MICIHEHKEDVEQNMEKRFNVCQNIHTQRKGDVQDRITNQLQQNLHQNKFPEEKRRISPSWYQGRDNRAYSQNEALKQLPEATTWPNFLIVGGYVHMDLINYVGGHFIDVPRIPQSSITDILNTELKGNASIWYSEMKEIHGRRKLPWWRSQIIQRCSKNT